MNQNCVDSGRNVMIMTICQHLTNSIQGMESSYRIAANVFQANKRKFIENRRISMVQVFLAVLKGACLIMARCDET